MTLRHRYVFLLSLLDSGMRMKKERKKLEAKKSAGKKEGQRCCYCKGHVRTAIGNNKAD